MSNTARGWQVVVILSVAIVCGTWFAAKAFLPRYETVHYRNGEFANDVICRIERDGSVTPLETARHAMIDVNRKNPSSYSP